MARLGIDFGTTNSSIVCYDKEKGFIYFDMVDDKPAPTPSTVWYRESDEVVVGKVAKDNIYDMSGRPGNCFVSSIKSKLGLDTKIDIFKDAVEPYEVASKIIEQLVKYKDNVVAEQGIRIDQEKSAVFTIPISFDGKARIALRKAAQKAGLDVETFIHEPFAAIVGYYYPQYKDMLKELNNKKILTFDWGGGTLDITTVKISDNKMEEIGTADLKGVAGDKFDELIAEWVWNKYLDQNGKNINKALLPMIKKNVWGALVRQSEKAKIALTTSLESEIIITINTVPFNVVITRDQFEKLIKNDVDLAFEKIDLALWKANVEDVSINDVLLIGGTSNIPYVQKRMKERFGARVEEISYADMLIAQGAAIISEMGWVPYLTKDIMVKLSDGGLLPIYYSGQDIIPVTHNAPLEFYCTDSTSHNARFIICEGVGSTAIEFNQMGNNLIGYNNDEKQRNDILAIINCRLLADKTYGDEIVFDYFIDEDIVLNITTYSKMPVGYSNTENYAEAKKVGITNLCFGLKLE